MTLFLGVDSGTQSTKVVVLDVDAGAVIGQGRAAHRLVQGLPPGHVEQEPAGWVEALDAAVSAALAGLTAADRAAVAGIGVSGQQHGFVALDDRGAVIRPAKLWCDTSTTAECEALMHKLGGPRATLRATGNLMLPGFTAGKIAWLKKNEPAHWRRLRHVLLPHDYLNFHLTGEYAMEAGDASGTALFDVRRRRWSEPAIAAIDRRLAAYLPAIRAPHEAIGTLRAAVAARYGLDPQVVVSAGGGDNMMGAIGTGNVVPGVVTASFGTSGTIYAHANRPVVDPRGEIAAFCSSTGGWLPLVCTMNVTNVTEEVRRLFGLDVAAFDAAVAAAPPGCGGLMMLPYFAGERTPNLPFASAALLGLTSRTNSPSYVARAAMEGATLGMNHGLARLRALGIRPREIRVTGGGARSPVWRQIMADVFGVPVVAMAEDEGAALGAALQAAWCVARRRDRRAKLTMLTERVVRLDEGTRCRPERARVARYRALQAVHDEASRALRAVFPRLGALSG